MGLYIKFSINRKNRASLSTSVGVDRLEDKQMLGKNDSRIVIAKISYNLFRHGSLTPASEKKCHEASKMAYFFVKFYKFISAISYYM